MHISHVVIKNFRALEDIQFELSPKINVIVGPNAIGKTTILQAIRLPKALIAPRTPNESQQTLISMGAASPHFPQRIDLDAFWRDRGKPVEIRCTYCLTDEEITTVTNALPDVVNGLIQARLGQPFSNPVSLIQFLNSEPGRQAQEQARGEVLEALEAVRRDKSISIGLEVSNSQIHAHSPVGALFIAYLDNRLDPQLTLFSYFPADRAMPVGEVAVQLGAADTQQQMEAHNSQPQLKFNRLKNTIFNTLIRSEADRAALKEVFAKISSSILTGRRILDPKLNELGLLSISIEEIDPPNRRFELDNLSSGEKGLILTFLLIARTIARGGIVLFDEPELHLNPAVCRDILPFINENYASPKNLQFVICTHSPQILESAFDQDDFALLHLETPTVLSRVGRTAYDEMADTLQSLGTSVSESLLFKGTVLVEGEDDIRLLQDGFGETLRRYKVSDLGGRREVEKTIKKIQSLELTGKKVDPIYLIFDHDNAPTDLKNSRAVRFIQWPRYCIENYLIDTDCITELLKAEEISKATDQSSGQVTNELRTLAFSQLDELAARNTFTQQGYLSLSFTQEDIQGHGLHRIAAFLYSRVAESRNSLPDCAEDVWTKMFLEKCNEERRRLTILWEASWKERCNGKRLFADFQKTGHLKVSPAIFKRRIIQLMKSTNSQNWRDMAGLLDELLNQSKKQ